MTAITTTHLHHTCSLCAPLSLAYPHQAKKRKPGARRAAADIRALTGAAGLRYLEYRTQVGEMCGTYMPLYMPSKQANTCHRLMCFFSCCTDQVAGLVMAAVPPLGFVCVCYSPHVHTCHVHTSHVHTYRVHTCNIHTCHIHTPVHTPQAGLSAELPTFPAPGAAGAGGGGRGGGRPPKPQISEAARKAARGLGLSKK